MTLNVGQKLEAVNKFVHSTLKSVITQIEKADEFNPVKESIREWLTEQLENERKGIEINKDGDVTNGTNYRMPMNINSVTIKLIDSPSQVQFEDQPAVSVVENAGVGDRVDLIHEGPSSKTMSSEDVLACPCFFGHVYK